MSTLKNRDPCPARRTGAMKPAVPCRAYVAYAAAAFYYFYDYVLRMQLSTIADHLKDDFGANASDISNLGSMFFYAYAAMQVPFGTLFDTFGARPVLVVCSLLCASGTLLFALAPSTAVAGVARVLVGIGAGCAWLVSDPPPR